MRIFFAIILILGFCHCNSITATSLSISSGTGLDDTLIQSGDISSTSANGVLFSTALIDDIDFYFDLTFDLSIEFAGYKLKGNHNDLSEEMDIYQIKPKLRWRSESNYYLDIGLGVASLGEDHWEEVKYNGTTNFALSFALGWSFGEQDQVFLDLVYNHYSNGYTRSPNPGLDFVTLNLGYVF